MSGIHTLLASLPLDELTDGTVLGTTASSIRFFPNVGLSELTTTPFLLLVTATVFSLNRLWTKPSDAAGNRSSESELAMSARDDSGLGRHTMDESAPWNALARGQAAVNVIDTLQERLTQALSGSDDHETRWLLNSVPDGLCVSDSRGLISRSNPAFLSILGVDEVVDVNIVKLISELSSEISQDIGTRLQNGATSLNYEIRTGEDSEQMVLRLSCSPLLDDESNQRGLVWSLRDITQQKLADEMRNEFVFTATHELRTPLANLRAYAETLTLEDDIDVEQQKEFCNIILSEATRLARFVDELLDVSQMEGGSLNITRSPVDMERLVNEVVDNVQPDITRRHQKFNYQPPAKMPKLTGDKDKLMAALVNLLGNASKYSPEGGEIGLQIVVDERQIQFHVDDTGYGISEEEQAQIFDKFFRSGDERVLAESGNGLGLAYTQQVIRLHGGQITVKSELDRGSRFTLTMPLK